MGQIDIGKTQGGWGGGGRNDEGSNNRAYTGDICP